MADPTGRDLRCPRCRAAVRDGDPWCTQCYTSLTVAPSPPAAEQGPVARPPLARAAPHVAVQLLPEDVRASRDGEATWPCTTCGQTNPLADTACRSCGLPFLAALRESETPLLALPGVGDVTALSRAQRLGLGMAVVVAVVALTLLLSLLTG